MFFTSRGFSFFWDVVILNRNRTETTFLPVQRRKEIAMANMYRDVNLSEVNESYIGKELKVAGWVKCYVLSNKIIIPNILLCFFAQKSPRM